MSQEVASQNPLNVEFTGANVASALFETFSESVVLNNGTTLTRGDALKTFLDNMSYMAPERYTNVFWHGNEYGNPRKWGGMIYYCDLLATDSTRPLFNKICDHYKWKKTYEDGCGFNIEIVIVEIKK